MKEGISVTELEMVYGNPKREKVQGHSLVLLRSPDFTEKLFKESGSGTPDFYDDGGGKLAILKDHLREVGLVGREGYRSLEEFGEAVEKFLLAGLQTYFPETEKDTLDEPSDRAHAIYAQSRQDGYVPLKAFREKVWERITQEGTSAVLQVVGDSGLGKSALLADLERWIPTRSQDLPWIFAHYIGADGDRSLSGWRDRLFRLLVREGFLKAERIPAQETERWTFLPEALFQAQKAWGRGIILLLDALDQVILKEELSNLKLLQGFRDVRLILTCTPESQLPFGETLAMSPLDSSHRKEVIGTFREKYRKNVDNSLLKKLVDHPSCAVPLYLRLLLEELRLHANHETLHSWTDELLKEGDAGGLFLTMLAGIDRDVKEEDVTDLGSRGARLIAASRRGLRRRDLAVLLEKDTSRSRLPDRLLSPVLARLEPFCLDDNGRLYIMHALLRSRLLEGGEISGVRESLINYVYENENESLAEKLYQFDALKDEEGLREILGDIDRVITLWEYDPKLLEAVLISWGAGSNEVSSLLTDVSRQWKSDLTSRAETLPKMIDALGVWLSTKSFRRIIEPLLEGILSWRMSHCSADDLIIARSYNDFGSFYQEDGRFKDAEVMFVRALEIDQISLSPENSLIATALNNLGLLRQKQGRYEDAESLFKKALEIDQISLPSGHPSSAKILNNLAETYLLQGKLREAEPLAEKALKITKSNFLSGYPDIFPVLMNLGLIYLGEEKFKEAESIMKEALEIVKSSLPAHHPDIATGLNNLALFYHSLNRLEETEPLYKEALEIWKSILPAGHPDIATGLNNLAALYQMLGRFEEAAPLANKALEIRKSSLSPNHPDIAMSLNNLATLYLAMGDSEKAEELFKEALEIFKSLGDPNILKVLLHLASLYREQVRLYEAEALLKEALEILKISVRQDQPYIVEVLNALEELHQAQEHLEETVKFFLEDTNA